MSYDKYNTSGTFKDVLGHTNITVGSSDPSGTTIRNTIVKDGVTYRAVGTNGRGTSHISSGQSRASGAPGSIRPSCNARW